MCCVDCRCAQAAEQKQDDNKLKYAESKLEYYKGIRAAIDQGTRLQQYSLPVGIDTGKAVWACGILQWSQCIGGFAVTRECAHNQRPEQRMEPYGSRVQRFSAQRQQEPSDRCVWTKSDMVQQGDRKVQEWVRSPRGAQSCRRCARRQTTGARQGCGAPVRGNIVFCTRSGISRSAPRPSSASKALWGTRRTMARTICGATCTPSIISPGAK